MWTFFRAKKCRWVVFAAVAGWQALSVGCASQAPKQVSLYTPVRAGQAAGPLPEAPVAYYPYQPVEIHALAEVPAPVAAKAVATLKARVGEAFYKNLRFISGQRVDLNELHRVNPASRRFPKEAPTYLLRFDFALPKAGISRYTVEVALRSDGSLVRPILLPAFGADPAEPRLKPLPEVAADLAKRGLIDRATTTTTVDYDPARDTLVWHFEQILPGTGAEVKTRAVDVDARTGEIIRSFSR